jgi:subtilase family serine protease
MAALAVALVACGDATAAASPATGAAASPQAVRVGASPRLPKDARKLAPLAASKPLKLTVALKSQDPTGLARFAEEVSTPSSPRFRQYLTVAQFAQRFGATPVQVAAVRSALQEQGLTVEGPDANELTLSVRTTASQVEQALSVSLSQVELASGRKAYANAQAPSIPATAAGFITGVIGLDNVTPDEPQRASAPLRSVDRQAASRPASSLAGISQIVTGGPQPCQQATEFEDEEGGYTADKIASAYQLSNLYLSGDLGAGQTVALFEQEPFDPADISAYQECFGTSATVSSVDVDGGPEGPVSEDGESALDIEQIIGLAPQAHVIVYQGPEEQEVAPVDIISAIVSQDQAKVISSSWGVCESLAADFGPTVIAAENTLLQEAAAQGQSFFVSSGDTGSEQCAQVHSSERQLAVLNPAGQPFATGVGGTALFSREGSTLRYYDGTLPPSEGIWNYGFHAEGGAGGGGISKEFAMPSYQSSASPSLGVINANSSSLPCAKAPFCREVPDVSADADPQTGYIVFDEGEWTVVGGTSASAPLWAAFTSLANASPACGGVPIGFANPALYSIASAGYASNFADVLEPSLASPRRANNNPEGTGLFPLVAGYDMAAGIGTPIGAQLAGSLCAQARFTPEAPQQEAAPPEASPALPAARPSPATAVAVTPSPGSSSNGVTTTVSAAQLKSQLTAQLTPSGKAAKLASLLKANGYTLAFKAPEAGSLTIDWYELPPGAKLAKKAKPVLVADGRLTFTAARAGKIVLKFTAAGKALLKRSKQLKLTAKGTFTPQGKATLSATKTFMLRR